LNPVINRCRSLCILPELSGLGGPASFQSRLVDGLGARGWRVTFDPSDPEISALLVIGGPRRLLPELVRVKRRGVRIVQRLNGMNWIHRKHRSGLRYYLNAELNNLALAGVRRMADRIVYQSLFSREWWERVYGVLRKPQVEIYNGVDLTQYTPEGPHLRPENHIRLLLVEGHLSKGFEMGLTSAVRLTNLLREELSQPLELVVVGDVPEEVRAEYSADPNQWITWAGVVPRQDIPSIDRSAHLLFSADINAACPNSVVEALACGLPVVGFSTGALPEMVTEGAGIVVPYGGNPWELEPPSLVPLVEAARCVISRQDEFRQAARVRANAAFDLKKMVDQYITVLLD
jgi:glycosyltransferase involved in cell wall biosynthesis